MKWPWSRKASVEQKPLEEAPKPLEEAPKLVRSTLEQIMENEIALTKRLVAQIKRDLKRWKHYPDKSYFNSWFGEAGINLRVKEMVEDGLEGLPIEEFKWVNGRMGIDITPVSLEMWTTEKEEA